MIINGIMAIAVCMIAGIIVWNLHITYKHLEEDYKKDNAL